MIFADTGTNLSILTCASHQMHSCFKANLVDCKYLLHVIWDPHTDTLECLGPVISLSTSVSQYMSSFFLRSSMILL